MSNLLVELYKKKELRYKIEIFSIKVEVCRIVMLMKLGFKYCIRNNYSTCQMYNCTKSISLNV